MLPVSYNHIITAIDGSENGEKALKKAIAIAKIHDAKLTAVYIVDNTIAITYPYTYDEGGSWSKLFETEIRELEKRVLAIVDEKEFNRDLFQFRTANGNPKYTITDELVPEMKADLVICGARGLSKVDRIILGSVSENIVRRSPVDVMVVK